MASAYDIENRVPITAAMMLGSLLVTIDTTIANVALPHMQGSFSASQDQTAWVLTSYIVGTAVMMPLGGWLAGRLGYKTVFLFSIGGFTLASLACGLSTNLAEIVVFRFIQGICGASLMPLSQSVVLDIFEPERIGQVMALTAASIYVGPVIGPVLGGWLTDHFSWRWVFLVNLPVGVLAFVGISIFMSPGGGGKARPFDFLGFGALAVFIVALQLLADRGLTLDWFSSREIQIEAIVTVLGLWIFVVQTLTAREPFFDRELARDGNFVTAIVFAVAAGMILFTTFALQPPLMQGLLGYSVLTAGLAMAPRGIGTLLSMAVVGRLIGRVDTRLMLITGLSMVAVSMFQMSHFDLSMDERPFVLSGLIQGFGTGFIFLPLNVLAFASMKPHLRAQGSVVFALTRSMGQSIGISITELIYANRAAVAHSDLAAKVQPGSPVLSAGLPGALAPGGLTALNGEITRQSSMVGYIDCFRLAFVGALVIMPLIMVLRPGKKQEMTVDMVAD